MFLPFMSVHYHELGNQFTDLGNLLQNKPEMNRIIKRSKTNRETP